MREIGSVEWVMHHPRTCSILSVAALLALGSLAGCSSEDAEPESTTTTVPATSTTEAPTTTTTAAIDDAAVATDAVEIRDYRFQPDAIVVAVGDTVTWTNADEFQHTSTQEDDLWDSTPLDPGASFSHTFTEPGTYAYLCNIHNTMTAEVVVE